MKGSVKLCFSLALLFLFADLAVSADTPAPSPSPPGGEDLQHPASPPDAPATPPSPGESPPSDAPAPPPSESSPPAPPPSHENVSPSPPPQSPSPASAPEPKGNEENIEEANDDHLRESDSDDGLKGGQKAGIAIGVILGAGIVGLGGFVYKKRRDNIRRSQYGYAARRELL